MCTQWIYPLSERAGVDGWLLRENELVAMLVANRKTSASLYTILATFLGGEFNEYSILVELHRVVEFGGIYKSPW